MARPRKYRLWMDEEKRSICQQTRGPGISVAQVARRYAMNANLIFKWLRDPRFNPPLIEDCTASFLPVKVVAVPPIIDPPVIEPKVSEAKIEISRDRPPSPTLGGWAYPVTLNAERNSTA